MVVAVVVAAVAGVDIKESAHFEREVMQKCMDPGKHEE